MTISEAIQQAVPELTKTFAEWWNSKGKNQIDLEDPDTRQTAESYIGYVKDKSLLFDETAVQTASDWESFLWNAYTNRQEKGHIEGEIVFGNTSFSADDPEEDQEIPDFTPSVPQSLPEAEKVAEPEDEPEELPEEEAFEEPEYTPEPEPEVEEEIQEDAEESEVPEETEEVEEDFGQIEESTEEPRYTPEPEEDDEDDDIPENDIPKQDVFDYVESQAEEASATDGTEEQQAEAGSEAPSDETLDTADEEAPCQADMPEAGTQLDVESDEPAKATDDNGESAPTTVDTPAEKPHIVGECVQQFLFSDEEMGIVRKKAAEKLASLPIARHQVFDDALFALQSGLKVNLYGPAGSGRHTLAHQLKEECGTEPKVSLDREAGYANFLVGYDAKLEEKICPKAHPVAENLRAAGTDVLLAQCIVIEKLLPLGEQKAISAI
jgi:ABC-type multidrug transport system fused ATPase/permease subunit